eukprot:TRINITY_DN1536_c0_g1_i1.p1 TRINITY_DN1536_c0_g1~~TRINITY_DN1536_c0_g1_i1.p1  ORF type:complete len:299 (-),score=72.98 TRINITY_DN1536_c0_g1_i1:28-924(-)
MQRKSLTKKFKDKRSLHTHYESSIQLEDGLLTNEDERDTYFFNHENMEVPTWLLDVDILVQQIMNIEEDLANLHMLYSRKPTIGKKYDEKEVEETTEGIIEYIKEVKAEVKQLGREEKLTDREKALLENIKMGFTSKLAQITEELNASQNKHLADVSQRKQKTAKFAIGEKDDDDDGFLYSGFDSPALQFSDRHLDELEASNAMIQHRDEEIERIMASMRELSSLFNDMADLVIEQGTMLDRIDQHIASASTNVNVAIENLDKTRKTQAGMNNCWKGILAAVVIGVIIVIIFIIISSN